MDKLNDGISLLDCTLRDGGRLFDCEFTDYQIKDISRKLSECNIEYVEMGFLRDPKNVKFEGNSTFFTDVSQIDAYVPEAKDTKFLVFIDYGMCDFEAIPEKSKTKIDGFRIGFTKKNFDQSREDVIQKIKSVQNKGYLIFIQGVNSLAYSDEEFIDLIKMINSIKPHGFGVVDTYGAMYIEDVERFFNIVNNNLDEAITIDFHAHNNRQMAFALSQKAIELKGSRNLVIDATLNGIGKCAGNLNLELITDYLNERYSKDYNFDGILDLIDLHIRPKAKEYSWGYSIYGLLGGKYKSHPNNLIYLSNKYKLQYKDFKNILSMIDPELRQRYDYDNIERLYYEYNSIKCDDEQSLIGLKKITEEKEVLVLAPGHSIVKYADYLDKYIKINNPVVITVGFVRAPHLCFCSSTKRFEIIKNQLEDNVILTSNVESKSKKGFVVDYSKLVDYNEAESDNSVIMLLNLLKILHVQNISIAGFDGFEKSKENYLDSSFRNDKLFENYDEINKTISKLLDKYIKSVNGKIKVEFITPSIYQIRGVE